MATPRKPGRPKDTVLRLVANVGLNLHPDNERVEPGEIFEMKRSKARWLLDQNLATESEEA